MVFTSKIAKAQKRLVFNLTATFFIWSVFIMPAEARTWIAAALDELTEAQNTIGEAARLKLLALALRHLNQTVVGDHDQKELAIASTQSAISDLQSNDTTKANEDIAKAILETKAAMGKGGSDETTSTPQTGTNSVGTASPPPATPAPPVRTAPVVNLTEAQAAAVVLIKGDNGEGTGFLVKTADGPTVITNIHVISNNPHLQITTNRGVQVQVLSFKGATDRDLAMIAIKDNGYNYLDLATDVSGTVQPGDAVVTPGNSEGGEVMLNTGGKVLGIGPQRVEIDNPVYHGNSGGPIFHVKSGKVIGVVTEAIQVDITDSLDKASFASRNSAISNSMRYFGMRIDNVPKWEPYDWNRLQAETLFLDQFDKRNRCLDCYLNAPNDQKPEDLLYIEDDKIVKANNDFNEQTSGDADISQKMDAVREWQSEMYDIADTDMDAIQNPNNFYTFDQQRATDEIAYRKAIKAELATMGNNFNRVSSMARTNN
jgi:hypothetical protein